MSDQPERYTIPRKEADLLRRAIGAAIRPRKSVSELAIESRADYDVLRDFLRSRSSSFRRVEDRDSVRRCADQCLTLLGLKSLADAERLPPYAPRRTSTKSAATNANHSRLAHRLNAVLKSIPEKQLSDAASVLKGMFVCYRILEDKIVRSKIYIYRHGDASWLEFTEVWKREGDLVEYNGYIFPTAEFYYFFGTHRKYGVPRTIVGRISSKKGQALLIVGIVTGHSPARGMIVSSSIFMEKTASDFKSNQDFRMRVTLDETGDIDFGELPKPFASMFSSSHRRLVSVQSDQL